MKKKLYPWVLVSAIILLSIVIIEKQTAQEPEKIDIGFNQQGKDIASTDEGTLIIFTKIDITEFLIEPTQRLANIVLFNSNVLPGFKINYNFIESELEAGLPIVSSKAPQLIDGNMHQIGYTYKKNDKQELFLDGIKVASGVFTGEQKPTMLTGFAVKESNELISAEGIEVLSFEKALTEGEIKEIFNNKK